MRSSHLNPARRSRISGPFESRSGTGRKVFYYAFFPAAVLYLELLLHLFAKGALFDRFFLYLLLFSAACGGILWLIGTLLPPKRIGRITLGVLLGALTVVFITEYCVRTFFKNFYELRYMFRMTADIAKGYSKETVGVIFSNLGFILLAILPLAVFILFRKRILPDRRPGLAPRGVVLLAVIVLQTVGVLIANHGAGAYAEDRDYYRSMYSANAAIARFGLVTDLRLEMKYALFGVPVDLKTETKPKPEPEETAEPAEPEPEPEYAYNVLDIDFNALAASRQDDTLKSMDQYFGSLQPTQQNEYTGLFEGKNLIMLTCEALSHYAIRQDITPTLYKMQHEGFYFTNFYQPDWTQSTTGGEFSAMSGMVPTWVDGSPAFYKTADNAMPYSLGNQFRAIGYKTYAYHNNNYGYYNRDETHPNMGYDYRGIGNGLVLENRYGWPESDYEMMKATLSEYVDAYAETGQKFHAYYMTVSGHGNYGWSENAMAGKNREVTENLPYSTPVMAYLASQVELEYALKYIVDYCTEKGVLDDVVIALTADHYPYALSENGTDYYNELEGEAYNEKMTERFRNALVIWSASMEKPVRVTVPCSSIDMVPTLSNLFGLAYDSRLYSGRDILAENYDVADPDSRQPFVIFADDGAGISWISCAGVYNAYTRTFTPYNGYESYAENTGYIDAMKRKANDMHRYAYLIIKKDYYAKVTPSS